MAIAVPAPGDIGGSRRADSRRADSRRADRRRAGPGRLAPRATTSGVAGRVDRGGRSAVADIQRGRMIAAMAALARERGAAAVSVAQVVARSGVSRRTFYELFADRDDCLAAAFEHGVARAAARVLPAYQAAGGWRERMRAGLAALLEFLEEDPDLARLCVVAALGASPVTLDRRAEVVAALVDAVDAGRREARQTAQPTRVTAEGVVGAVLTVLHARFLDGAPVAGLEGSLMATIVLPYLGLAAASHERATPAARGAKPAAKPPPGSFASGDPLRELRIRLTYRTAQTLLAIGELGADGAGPSNRQVADAAGISDPGQISKLLSRLQSLGLIENGSRSVSRGEPNVWRLTRKGQDVEGIIRQQTDAP